MGADIFIFTPEQTLRQIFAQAFAGESITLPDGATVANLISAVSLDDKTITRIFLEERQAARHRQRIMELGQSLAYERQAEHAAQLRSQVPRKSSRRLAHVLLAATVMAAVLCYSIIRLV